MASGHHPKHTGRLRRLRRKPHKQPYLLPGTLVATSTAAGGVSSELELIQYDAEHCVARRFTREPDRDPTALLDEQFELAREAALAAGESASAPAAGGVAWLNCEGLGDVELVGAVGNRFGLHPLVQEDILHTAQRPKVDDYEDYLFIVLHMITLDMEQRTIDTEQVSLVLGREWLLTFQEGKQGDCFEVVRERLRRGRGRLRREGADYLAYGLIDAIVDHHFEILERLGDWIEELEEEAVARPTQATMQRIYALRRELLLLRKSVWPLRDVINVLVRDESDVLREQSRVFFRDVYDHAVQVIETMETYRDMLGGMLEIYLSSLSNRMNEIMKVLTIISTVFMPLSFIVGVYGMNFEVMPELHWRYGYLAVWGLIATAVGGMLAYFRRKHWI